MKTDRTSEAVNCVNMRYYSFHTFKFSSDIQISTSEKLYLAKIIRIRKRKERNWNDIFGSCPLERTAGRHGERVFWQPLVDCTPLWFWAAIFLIFKFIYMSNFLDDKQIQTADTLISESLVRLLALLLFVLCEIFWPVLQLLSWAFKLLLTFFS